MEKRTFSEIVQDINGFMSEMDCESLASLYESLAGNKECEFNSEESIFEVKEKK